MRLFFLCGGVVLLLAGLEYLRRRRAWLDGPNYCQHLEQWRVSEPVITPAQLPDVKVLKDSVTRRKLAKHDPLRFKAGRRAQ